MLGMSHFLGSPLLSGSQRQSEKQSESDILHFIFLRFHTLTRFFGVHSHSFYAMLGMSHFLGSPLLSGSQKVPTSFLKLAFYFQATETCLCLD
jgi:hypothetical protein